jgi:hypothetical protein
MKAQPPRRFYALNRDQASRDARPRAGATIQRHRRGAEHVNVLRGPPRSPPAGLINVITGAIKWGDANFVFPQLRR